MDATPPRFRSREPILNLPRAVTAVLGLILAVHALRVFVLSDESDLRMLLDLALVPARVTAALDLGGADAILRDLATAGGSPAEVAQRTAFARYLVTDPEVMPWTFLSYAGLHGSWAHAILNSVWLAAFGTPVARRCGTLRFAAIGLVSIAAGGLLHYLIDPNGIAPLIGASAGVSGLMAAAARFVFAPRPAGRPGLAMLDPPWAPLQPVGALLRNRPAALFLAIWLVTNLVFGLAATPFLGDSSAIAWDAHLGGFLAGFLLMPLFDRRTPP